jgi:methyl-accepting chemotaxis protein
VDLEVFREQVRFLEESFDDLAAACETAAQRAALSRDLATAQNNLARAVSAVFDVGDTRVQDLQQEMREGQAQIEQLQIDEQNIANVLNLITGVVRAGASLVALAI